MFQAYIDHIPIKGVAQAGLCDLDHSLGCPRALNPTCHLNEVLCFPVVGCSSSWQVDDNMRLCCDPDYVIVSLPEGGEYLLDEITGKVLQIGSLAMAVFRVCQQPISLEDCFKSVGGHAAEPALIRKVLESLLSEKVIRLVDLSALEQAVEDTIAESES